MTALEALWCYLRYHTDLNVARAAGAIWFRRETVDGEKFEFGKFVSFNHHLISDRSRDDRLLLWSKFFDGPIEFDTADPDCFEKVVEKLKWIREELSKREKYEEP